MPSGKKLYRPTGISLMFMRKSTIVLNATRPLFFSRYARQPILHTKNLLFSDEVWQKAQPCMQMILNSSFIEKLIHGSLDEADFANFLVNDQAYLRAYKAANQVIAKRLPTQIQAMLKSGALSFTNLEQQTIEHIQKQLKLQSHGQITPATQAYAEALLYSANCEPVELAFALKLPCDLVFKRIANHIAIHTPIENNKFRIWYSTYTTEQFHISSQRKLDIFNRLADQQSPCVRQKMCAKFLEGMQLECEFFDSLPIKISNEFKNGT